MKRESFDEYLHRTSLEIPDDDLIKEDIIPEGYPYGYSSNFEPAMICTTNFMACST